VIVSSGKKTTIHLKTTSNLHTPLSAANWVMTGRCQEGGFQNYTMAPKELVAHLPSNVSFAAGCVLPLSMSTAAMSLYPSYRFGLPFPQLEPKPLNRVLLVWGGASTCGSSSIQLAVASGATVIATTSTKNHAYVKNLGASVVLDYNDETVVEKLIEEIKKLAAGFPGEFKDKFIGAFDSIATKETLKSCIAVAYGLGGGKVVTLGPELSTDAPEGVTVLPGM
jgi:NADPH:quinone reductase-like Zn-dependent oxidoreductase